MIVEVNHPNLSVDFKVERVYPTLEDLEVTPTIEDQTFKSEKYGFDNVTIKKVTSEVDSNIKPEHIKEGVNILGVDGGYSGIDTSDATATAGDLLKDKTAYANGGKIVGTIEEYDGSYEGSAEIGDPDLIPENIRAGVKIFGVEGTAEVKGEENTVMLTNISSVSSGGLKKYILRLPQLNTTGITNTMDMFREFYALTEIPQLDTSKVTNMKEMFYRCQALTTIPELDTSKAVNMYGVFYYCIALKQIPQLDASNVNNVNSVMFNCTSLENFGGFKNLGKAFTQTANNYSNYKLDLSKSILLTHESLMNVINNLYDLNLTYDVANGGTLYRQQLVLGSTNLEKLTAEEITIATNKGWDVT